MVPCNTKAAYTRVWILGVISRRILGGMGYHMLEASKAFHR
jgi:hypothetical protein